MKIIIEKDDFWKVTYENRVADKLQYEEMLGVVASLTMPESRPCLQWLETEEQRKAKQDPEMRYPYSDLQEPDYE